MISASPDAPLQEVRYVPSFFACHSAGSGRELVPVCSECSTANNQRESSQWTARKYLRRTVRCEWRRHSVQVEYSRRSHSSRSYAEGKRDFRRHTSTSG